MEQEQAVAPTNAVATISDEERMALESLAEGSGELEQTKSYLKLPYITVDNRMVEVEIPGANGTTRKTKVRCEPSFVINEKVEDEYKVELFAPEFEAILLKFKHRVQRKYLQDKSGNCINKMPFYKSLEFDSFKSDIHIYSEKQFLQPMKYSDVKKFAFDGNENELWGIAYVLIKGETMVRKLEFKGASRSELYDYMTAKRDEKVAERYTKFSVVTAEDAAQPYNKLVITRTDERPESYVLLAKMQRELNDLLDNNAKPSVKAQEGVVLGAGMATTVVDDVVINDVEPEIVIQNIPFN